MQTFLPSPDFAECARVLDGKRLNKQITEVKQILMAITGESDGWRNHPAVAMWRGHYDALIEYGVALYDEWQSRLDLGKRGGKRTHKSGEWITACWLNFHAWRGNRKQKYYSVPWLTPDVCSAYRALLLAKDPEWYGQFGWSEEPNADSKRIFEMIKEEMKR